MSSHSSSASFEEEFKEATKPGPNRKIPGAVLIAADKTGKYINDSLLIPFHSYLPINVMSFTRRISLGGKSK